MKDGKTGQDPGAEGYPAWASLPLLVLFLTVEPDFQGWVWCLVQFNTVLPSATANRPEKESRWIETQKAQRQSNDKVNLTEATPRAFYANVSAVFAARTFKRVGCNQQLAAWQEPRIKQDGSKGWCQVCVCWTRQRESDPSVNQPLRL